MNVKNVFCNAILPSVLQPCVGEVVSVHVAVYASERNRHSLGDFGCTRAIALCFYCGDSLSMSEIHVKVEV